MSAKYSLPVYNTVDGHPTFKPNIDWFYQLPESDLAGFLTAQAKEDEAWRIFLADTAREAKLKRPRPDADAGFVWELVGGAVTDDGATWWVGRNRATQSDAAQLSTYLDAEAGLSLISRYISAAGITYDAVFAYDAVNGYPRPGLINPARPGGVPKYAALHNNIPNGSGTLQVVTTSGVIKRSQAITITDEGPIMSLLSAPVDNGGGSGGGTIPATDYFGGVLGNPPTGTDSDGIPYESSQFAPLGV